MKKSTYNSLLSQTSLLVFCLFCISCSVLKPNSTPKWEQLFNGKDLADWQIKIRHHDLNENFANTYQVKDGQIQVRYDGYTNFDKMYGHLFYKKPYSYYLLAVEYRFTGNQPAGGEGWAFRNSGVMLHGQDPTTMKKDQDFPNSIEVQFLGGNGKDKRPTANCCTPGTDIVINGKLVKQHCTNSTSQTYHGDQWVRVEVLVLGDSVMQHFVNGESVMRYERPQTDPPRGSAPGTEGQLLKSGTISLQSESHPIDFRKVEIIDLEKYAKNPTKLGQIIAKLTSEKRVAVQ